MAATIHLVGASNTVGCTEFAADVQAAANAAIDKSTPLIALTSAQGTFYVNANNVTYVEPA